MPSTVRHKQKFTGEVMLRKAQDPVVETRNVTYDINDFCVIFVNAPQSDYASKQGWRVDVVIP